MGNNDDLLWMILLAAGAVVAFGGTITAWIAARGQEAIDWLTNSGLLVEQSQALIGVAGIGVDLPRLILGVGSLIILGVIVGSIRRAMVRKAAMKAMGVM